MLFSNMARLTGSENNNASSGTGNKTANGNSSSNGDSTGHNYTPCTPGRPPHLPSLDLSLHTSNNAPTRKSAPNSLNLNPQFPSSSPECSDYLTLDLDHNSSLSPQASSEVENPHLPPGTQNVPENVDNPALENDLKDELKTLLFSEHFWSMGNVNSSQQQQLHEMIEKSLSQTSRDAVDHVLQKVTELTNLEKLLLVMKLRSSHVQEDPLRLPNNPLGSRPEISLTVTWISTHLEEDASTSLPKHEVYEEYMAHCQANHAKALSTADFGKVMKQVFPTVRPRRLGTRGHSRYCYSGLRKRMKVDPPLLPDLDTHSTAATSTEDILQEASSCVIREWSEKLLTANFASTQALAMYLVDKLYVDHRSKAAKTLLELTATKTSVASETPEPEPAEGRSRVPSGSSPSKNAKGSDKEHMRELKRKLQEQHLVATKSRVTTGRTTKKTKVSSQAKDSLGSENESNDGVGLSSTAEYAINTSVEPSVTTPPVKETKRRSRKTQDKSHAVTSNATGIAPHEEASLTASHSQDHPSEKSDLAPQPPKVNELSEIATANVNTKKKGNPGKVPIPRLQTQRPSRALPALSSIILVNPVASPQPTGKKYVPIQPKYKTEPEECPPQVPSPCRVDPLPNMGQVNQVDHMSHVTPDLSAIKGPVRETDEELLRYLGNHNDANEAGLGQLRALLEQNLSEKHSSTIQHSMTIGACPKTELVKDPLFARRRVSFDTLAVSTNATPATEISPMHAIPPSPNTRRKAFNFTPISPRHTPVSDTAPSLRTLLSSQSSSSTNASPFVSPRTTPGPESNIQPNLFLPPANAVLCRSRHNSASSLLVNRVRHSSGASVTLRHAPYPSIPYGGATSTATSTQEHEAALALRSRHNSADSHSPKSAPLSPLVTQNDMMVRASATNQPSGDLRRRHMSAGTILGQHKALPSFQTMTNSSNSNNHWNDPFSQEIEKLLADPNPVLGSNASTSVLLRSQSVPLHTMAYNQSLQNSLFQRTNPAFGSQDNSSHSYSPYTPTPVPSDWADFNTNSNDGMMASHVATMDPTAGIVTTAGTGTAEGSEDDTVALESLDPESLRELMNHVYASEALNFNQLDGGVMGNELETAQAVTEAVFEVGNVDRSDPLDAAVFSGLNPLGNDDVVAALMSLREVAPGSACDLQRLVQDVSQSRS